MKVLLIKDVKSLGKAGELKEVKDGYGHNFLISKGLAKLATPDVLRQYEAAQKRKAAKEASMIESLNETKEQLGKISLKIVRKLGANGSLFGSITKDEIAEALEKDHDIQIDKKSIEIDNTIKATGIYELDVKLGHSIHAKLKLEVKGE